MSNYKIVRAGNGYFNITMDDRQLYRTDSINDAYYHMFLLQEVERTKYLESLQLELDFTA